MRGLAKETIRIWNLRCICGFLYLLLFSGFCTLNAQDIIAYDSLELASNRVSYSESLGLYVYGINKYSNFNFKEGGHKNDSVLKYSPNGNFNLGAGFSYKWLGIGAAFNLGFVNNDNDLKGETTSLDLQVDLYSKRYFFNGNLQYYSGYYWQNPNVFYPDWNINDSLVVRPDITTVTAGVNGIYIFNHERFAFKAAYQYTERQIKSAGSMLLGMRFSIYSIDADSSFIPTHLHEFYPNSTNIGGLSSLSLGASFGYTHTFILGKYGFVNGLLMTGLNSQVISTRDLNDDELESAAKMSSNFTLRLALGVNKPNVYYGMNFTGDSFLIKNPNATELSYSYGKFRMYYGRRFSF